MNAPLRNRGGEGILFRIETRLKLAGNARRAAPRQSAAPALAQTRIVSSSSVGVFERFKSTLHIYREKTTSISRTETSVN